MQFNPTSGRQGLIQDCEFWTGLGDAQISGVTANLQHFTRLINNRYHQVMTMIISSQDEWDFDDQNYANYPIITTSLVANQQDYVIPTSEKVLKIKRVEVSYDGTNWYRANPIDINEIATSTSTTAIASGFNQAAPLYDIQYDSIFLYPIPTANSASGLKVWTTREIVEFVAADTTAQPGFDEPFHRILSIGASLDWAVAKGLANKNDLAALYADYEQRLSAYYGSKQKDRVYILKPQRVEYGNK